MEIHMDIEKLISEMTVEEKLAQMSQFNTNCIYSESEAEITGPAKDMNLKAEDIATVGSTLNFMGAEDMIPVQRLHMERDPNKIPLLFMMDVIHGYRTIYPIPLGMGATWDPELLERCCAMAAKEAALGGVHVTFGPMVDLVRDARWGRCMESTGEDPYLNCIMSRAQVRGFQNGNGDKKYNVAACVKHFAAYGAAEAGRDYNTVDMSEHTLREYYLPAYRAAVDEGVKMLMTSFNLLNGIPAAANKMIIDDILRGEWGFDDIIITDYHSFTEMKAHGYTHNDEECAERGFAASTDIEMVSTHYIRSGKKLLEEGKLTMERIDESVRRILKLKEEMGLFENPYLAASVEEGKLVYLSKEHRDLCRTAAEKSAVLLKNDGVLPLSEDVSRVAVIGPFAKSGMIGFWSCHGKSEEAVSVFEGVEGLLGSGRVSYAEGCRGTVKEKPDSALIDEAVSVAEGADAVILCMGEYREMSGEGNSMVDVSLSEAQVALIRAVAAKNPNTVVLLYNGRPLALGNVIDDAPAFMTMWQPGTEGGSAAANLIFGKASFEGRLTMSFPYHVGQCPIYYNRMMTGRPKPDEKRHYAYNSNYLDYPNSPLFPFGYGLTYTDFEISAPKLSASSFKAGESLSATVTVKNVGDRCGTANVQLYIRDMAASMVRPIRELRGYRKVELAAGESATVSFTVDEEMLKFHTASGAYDSEAGEFRLFIGKNAEDGAPVTFNFEK